jgi:hypothetical protein
MRRMTQTLLTGALTLAWATPAYACGFWFNSTFLNVPMKPAIGVGLQSIKHFTVITADAAFKAGDKVVIRPAVGSCHYSISGFSETQTVYGAAVGVHLWNDEAGKVAINGQAGGEFDSFEGGSEYNIPIGAAVSFKASDMVDVFGGAAVNVYHASYDDGDSYSHNDLSIFAGASYKTGNFRLYGGLASFQYEDETQTALNVGATMELGGMNAFRAFRSLLHRN